MIVGVSQVNDRDGGKPGHDGASVIDLMISALRLAERDAGGDWLGRIDFLGVENQLSSEIAPWPGPEPITPHLVAAANLAPKTTMLTPEPSGDGPVHLLNHAANLIAAGESEVAAVVGAEALRTAAHRAANGGSAKASNMQALMDDMVRPYLRRYGLVTPADVYPLYESATRAAWGQSFEEAQQESAIMSAAYSKVAAENPDAWIRQERTPDDILSPEGGNRMVTFPYTKLMVANNAVNQGAAVIVTSLERALESGLDEASLIYVGAGASAHEDEDFLARDGYTASPAMIVSISKALEFNGLESHDLDHVELYNCFPCVAKMSRRVLDWPLNRPPSVYGGLVFGGGPIGNCMTHAIAAMTDKLRARGRNGLIFANGGFATHNHTIILSRTSAVADSLPVDFDVQHTADALRGPVPPLDEAYTGSGRIEAYTVPYTRDGRPAFAAIVGLSPEGTRFVCRVPGEDETTLEFLVSGKIEPIGTSGRVVPGAGDLNLWRPS